MGLYTKPALDLLGALINRDNPAIKTQLSSANIVVLGGPYTTSLGVSGRNTRIQVNGVAGSGVSGKMEFFYDRLNVGDLFKNITIVFDADSKSAKLKDLLTPLNEQYGLNLTAEDLANGEAALDFGYTASQVTFTIAATSLAYRGSLTATWSRKPVGIYPESGPGSKTLLMGDLTLGYFGVVSQAELAKTADIYGEMFAGVANTAAPTNDANLYWLKFARDGKFVYIPSRNLFTNISWNEIAAIGAVNADRKVPFIFPNANGEDALFQVRLPKLTAVDPVPAAYRGDPDSDITRLFNNIHTGAWATGAWDKIATFNVAEQFLYWNRSTVGMVNGVPVNGFAQTANFAGTNTTVALSAKTNWRPMLEFAVADDYLMPMRNIQAKLEVPVRSFAFAITSVIDSNMLQAMKNVSATLLRAVPAPVLYRPTVNAFKAVQDLRATNPVRSFAFKFTATYDRRIDLATTNGELSGF